METRQEALDMQKDKYDQIVAYKERALKEKEAVITYRDQQLKEKDEMIRGLEGKVDTYERERRGAGPDTILTVSLDLLTQVLLQAYEKGRQAPK